VAAISAQTGTTSISGFVLDVKTLLDALAAGNINLFLRSLLKIDPEQVT